MSEWQDGNRGQVIGRDVFDEALSALILGKIPTDDVKAPPVDIEICQLAWKFDDGSFARLVDCDAETLVCKVIPKLLRKIYYYEEKEKLQALLKNSGANDFKVGFDELKQKQDIAVSALGLLK